MIELSKEQLLQGLRTKRFGQSLFYFERIDSTNGCAVALASADAEEGTTVWSEYQTEGKGRLGRKWVGDAGKNLMISVVLREFPAETRSFLPYFVGESVASGVDRFLRTNLESKWPNDLLVTGRKCGGILIEGSESDRGPFAVAGIGINVNQTVFPADLADDATSLSAALGIEIDRPGLFQAIMLSLEQTFDLVKSGNAKNLLAAWEKRCSTLNRNISLIHGNEIIRGKAIGLTGDGGLMVETGGGLRTVYAGDVTVGD